MIIEWKPVIGFEGLYEVSACGRVRSLDREVPDAWGGMRLLLSRELSQDHTAHGYRRVDLIREGKRVKYMVHRLVATAYIREPAPWEQCNHKDRCRDNNHVNNLEWVTPLENTLHDVAAGSFHGITNPARRQRLTPEQVREIRALKTQGFGVCQIAKQFNVTNQLISDILHGKIWQGV